MSYDTGEVPALVQKIEAVWKEHFPLTPISHQFLTDMMDAQYAAEETQAQLFAAFSALAVVIACLGLYGLAAFTVEQRTKEIGIRKVLGASTLELVRLLVSQFSKPVLYANAIAWPLGWYFMSGWLESFEYRIDSSIILVVAFVAGLVALVVAWITVASRAVRVARTNPVHALRYE